MDILSRILWLGGGDVGENKCQNEVVDKHQIEGRKKFGQKSCKTHEKRIFLRYIPKLYHFDPVAAGGTKQGREGWGI